MINKFSNWLAGSLDNRPGGASSKKLSAFWALVILVSPMQFTWFVWAYKHDNWTLLIELSAVDLVFAATALGINAAEKIRGKSNPDQEVK
jgi:hypothetical protein